MTTRSVPWTWGGAILSGALMVATAFAQPGLPPEEPVAVQEQQVLTQGPVHEAFAEPITYDIQNRQTVVVPDTPPEPINEIPPDIKPDGDPQWIPGYFAWDVDEKRFIWISGLWRVAPVGHRWVPGYWTEVEGGFTWVSGVWVPEEQEEIAYLPYPPESVESGPNVPQPQEAYSWVPGCWIWFDGQWAWRPGYWVENYPNWVWIPAHHAWTPYGCIFVAGYWDFLPEERGLLFAPVWFPPQFHHVVYQPQICIHFDVLVQHLFVRPGFGHYYFGDFYDARYANFGIVPWFQFHRHRHGFDPIFAHRQWRHRHDRDWDRDLERRFVERRENIDLRPPRTFAQQRELIARVDVDRDRDRIRSFGLAENVNRLLDRRGPGDRVADGDRVVVRGDRDLKLVRLDASEKQRVTREAVQIKELRQARVEVDKQAINLRGTGRVGGRDTTSPRGDARGDVNVGERRGDVRADANVRVPKLKLPEVKRDTTTRRPKIDLDRGGDVKIDTDRPDVKLPPRPEPRRGRGDVGDAARDATDRVPRDADSRLRPRTNPLPGQGDAPRVPRIDQPQTPPKTDPVRPPRTGRGDEGPKVDVPKVEVPKVAPKVDVPRGNRGGSQRTLPDVRNDIPRNTTPRVNDEPRGNAPRIDIPRVDRGPEPRSNTPRDITPRDIAPRGNDQPRVQPRIDTTPRVQPRVDTTPRVQPRVDPTPRVQPRVDTTPRVQPRIDTTPRIRPQEQPRPQPRIDVTPRGGDSAPRIRGGEAPKVSVTPRESRPPKEDKPDRGKGKKD